MKLAILTVAAALLMLVGGCVTLNDKKPVVTAIREPDPEAKSFILLGDTSYYGQLAAAFSKVGLSLRPISTRGEITQVESATRLREYREAGDRYAIDLALRHDYEQVCVFSSNHHLVDATVTIIDIVTNEPILVLEQRGPDGECPPLTPVWDLIAREVATFWLGEGEIPAGGWSTEGAGH